MSRMVSLLAALGSLALAPSAWAQLLPPQNPHAGAVPITNVGAVVEANQTTEVEVGKGLKAKVLLSESSTEAKDVGMALITAPKGAEIPMHRHRGSEVVYVLEGKGEVTGLGASPQPFAAGDFVYNPSGVAHGVRTTEPSRLLVSFFPGGPELRYSGGKDPGTTPVGKDEPADQKHSIVIPAAKVQAHPVFGGKGTARVALDPSVAPFANVSATVLEIQPGTEASKLLHPHSVEVLYVTGGAVAMGLGAKQFEVTAPAAVRITPNVEHSLKVGADKPLEMLVYFSPPGPEQVYLKAPKK